MLTLILYISMVAIFLLIVGTTVRINLELLKISKKGLTLRQFSELHLTISSLVKERRTVMKPDSRGKKVKSARRKKSGRYKGIAAIILLLLLFLSMILMMF